MNLRRRAALGAAITAATVAVLAGSLPAQAQTVLNLYSPRHYQTDDALYAGFTDKTGLEIDRIEADSDALIERIQSEGGNSPPRSAERHVGRECDSTCRARRTPYQ